MLLLLLATSSVTYNIDSFEGTKSVTCTCVHLGQVLKSSSGNSTNSANKNWTSDGEEMVGKLVLVVLVVVVLISIYIRKFQCEGYEEQ